MRDEIIERAKSLIDEINKFKDVRIKIEHAETQLHTAKSENEKLNQKLKNLLSEHAADVKDKLHEQILEITKAYENILMGIFEKQVTGISATLSKIVSLSTDVLSLHNSTLNSIEASHNQSLERIKQNGDLVKNELDISKAQFSQIINELAVQIKDSGIQFNATSNVAQANFKKMMDGFVEKLESQAGEGISREFVKETVKQILQEGFEAATQQIREVAPIAKKQTDQIGELLASVNELKEELKSFNSLNNKSKPD